MEQQHRQQRPAGAPHPSKTILLPVMEVAFGIRLAIYPDAGDTFKPVTGLWPNILTSGRIDETDRVTTGRQNRDRFPCSELCDRCDHERHADGSDQPLSSMGRVGIAGSGDYLPQDTATLEPCSDAHPYQDTAPSGMAQR